MYRKRKDLGKVDVDLSEKGLREKVNPRSWHWFKRLGDENNFVDSCIVRTLL